MAGYFVCGFQGGLHRHPHAQLPEGQGPAARGGNHRPRPDRPVQRVRHLCLRRWASAWPSATSWRRSTLRSLVIVTFLVAPLTPMSVYLFASAMGLLWLSTVPPTNAVVAPDLRRAVHVDAGRLRVLQPPGGLVPRRVARWVLYDRTGSLHRGVVDRHCPRSVRGAGQPAGARDADPAPGAGTGVRRHMHPVPDRGCGLPCWWRWPWCSWRTSIPTWRSIWPIGCGPASDDRFPDPRLPDAHRPDGSGRSTVSVGDAVGPSAARQANVLTWRAAAAGT